MLDFYDRSQYYDDITFAERNAVEGSLVRLCMSRTEMQCSFLEYENYKVVYRRYASLFFIVGSKLATDNDAATVNELALLEFIHAFVETIDQYFENVCELDIVMRLDKTHFILNEMVMNGQIVETNRTNILNAVALLNNSDK